MGFHVPTSKGRAELPLMDSQGNSVSNTNLLHEKHLQQMECSRSIQCIYNVQSTRGNICIVVVTASTTNKTKCHQAF